MYSSFLKIILGCLLVLVGFLYEVYLGRVDFLISDGFKYYTYPENWIIDIDRAFWGYVNYFVKYFDIGGDFFIKIINIPILLITLYLFRDVFNRIKSPFWFVLACPSLLYLSISNLRDVLIWLMAILTIKLYFKKTSLSVLLALLCAIALYTLRPFMLVTALVSIFAYEVFFDGGGVRVSRMSGMVKKVGVLFAFALASMIVYPTVKNKLDSYLYNGQWLLESGYANIAKDKGVGDLVDSSNVPKALSFAVLRFIFTPQPDSIIRRWLKDDIPPNPYGLSSELLRLFNQIISYSIILYLLFNFKNAYSSLKKMDSTQRAVLTWCLVFLPIYAFVHFGGSHQRLKLPFQMMLFITACYTYLDKRENKKIIAS